MSQIDTWQFILLVAIIITGLAHVCNEQRHRD